MCDTVNNYFSLSFAPPLYLDLLLLYLLVASIAALKAFKLSLGILPRFQLTYFFASSFALQLERRLQQADIAVAPKNISTSLISSFTGFPARASSESFTQFAELSIAQEIIFSMGALSPLPKNSPHRKSSTAPEFGFESDLGMERTISRIESRRVSSDLSRPFSLSLAPSISKSCIVFLRWFSLADGNSFSNSASRN